MSIYQYYGLALLTVFLVSHGGATNIRGGSVTWRVEDVLPNGNVLMKTTVRLHVHSDHETCPHTLGVLPTCVEAVNAATEVENFVSTDNRCVDQCLEDKWSTTQVVDYSEHEITDACVMGYKDSGWIDNLSGSSDPYRLFSLPYYVDLRVTKNGRINSAPTAIIQPVVKFIMGCASSVVIPVFDEDGDDVSCRFAETEIEGGAMANMSYTNLALNQANCRLQYFGTLVQGTYAVALIVEDHPIDNLEAVNSYSSLQFTVKIVPAPVPGYPCTAKPTFVCPTPPNEQLRSLQIGETLTFTLQATPVGNSDSIDHFGMIGPNDITRGSITVQSNNEYQTRFSWTPTELDKGANYFCFEARESTGLVSEQRCIIALVGDLDPCQTQNGGCSHLCVVDPFGYHCECQHPCWELLEDQRQCVPKMVGNCTEERMIMTVEGCAVDGKIGVGDFDPDNMQNISAECANKGNNTHHHFDFGISQCGTEIIDSTDELKRKNSLKMWVDNDPDPVVTRGQWYIIEYICVIQKYESVSGVFDPQDSSTTIVAEDGFTEFQVAFDFYTDSSFQAPYGPADYPVVYTVNDKIYFGIYVESTDDDIELFTELCVALPEPEVNGIYFTMISNGCLQDETMAAHAAPTPKRNHFSVDAFRFNDELAGIDTVTDVKIACNIVVCVQELTGTRCDGGCVNSFLRSEQSDIFPRKRMFNTWDLKTLERGGNEPKSDPIQTNTIPLNRSPTISIEGNGSSTISSSFMLPAISVVLAVIML